MEDNLKEIIYRQCLVLYPASRVEKTPEGVEVNGIPVMLVTGNEENW